jgi:hypothetical protein
MSWKPSRSSGLTFAKYQEKSDKYRSLIIDFIENGKYLKFAHLNEFSKYIYLYWINENKSFYCFSSKSWTPGINDRYELGSCTILGTGIIRMFKNNKDKVYKPILNYLD